MPFRQFVAKQFIDVIQWNEPDEGILAYRFPMQDMEIQTGAQLTVRESQMAIFVNEGKVADTFGPGLYTLNTKNLPLLTDLKNWDKEFKSPFKSDVYFFATHLQIDQRWGTGAPIIVRDKEFGAVSIRSYGVYTYHVGDPHTFFTRVSGTLGTYRVGDIEGQLRAMIIGCITEVVANSAVPFLDLTANLSSLNDKLVENIKPAFADLGLELDQFVAQSVSLPDDLQTLLDQRIGMRMVGDLGHYTQFAAAESLPIAAANTTGAADMGIGLGAGAAVGQVMMGSLKSVAAAAIPAIAPESSSAVTTENHAAANANTVATVAKVPLTAAAAVAAPVAEPESSSSAAAPEAETAPAPEVATTLEAVSEAVPESETAPESHIPVSEVATVPTNAPAPTPSSADTEPETEDRLFCIYCGKQIPLDARFCPKCGKRQPSV